MRFLFCDKVTRIDKGKRILGIKNVGMSERFLADHFHREAIMPSTLIIEAVAQVAGWLIIYSYDFRLSVIMSRMEGVKVYRDVSPGTQLVLEADLVATDEDGSVACGRALIEREVVLNVERILFGHYVPPHEEFIRAEKKMFRYLSGSCSSWNSSS